MVPPSLLRFVLYMVVIAGLVVVAPAGAQSASSAKGKTKPIASALGPLPTNCPQGPKPVKYGPETGPGYGATPFWATFGGNPDGSPVLRYLQQLGPRDPEYGWPVKILFSAGPHAGSLTFTVHGWNLSTGQPARIEDGTSLAVAPLKIKTSPDMEDPQGWRFFPTTMYVPSAGCYVLVAQWKGSGWMVPFSAGR